MESYFVLAVPRFNPTILKYQPTIMLPGGTLETISGLQSEAGGALNGGRGLVIGKPAEDTGRYPVLVYAVVGKAEEEAAADSSSREVLSLADIRCSAMVIPTWNSRTALSA